MLKKVMGNMYIVAAAIFFLFSCASYVSVHSISILVGGITMSLLCLFFQYSFKVKWSEEGKTSLVNACKILEDFGKHLPLSIIGKLSMVWIVLLVLTFLKPVVVSIFPSVPTVIFTVISNLSFSLFIISTFYQVLSGNLKGISLSTELFALYNIVDVIVSFVFESSMLSIKAMSLFIAFWSIHLIFSVMLGGGEATGEEKTEEKKEEQTEEAPSEEAAE